MKYKIIPIALGIKIASSVHITYRICRRFASPQMYPISATQATTNRNIPYTHSACPQRGHFPISGSVGATKKNNHTVRHE